MKLNVYKDVEWNFLLRVGGFIMFYFILFNMTILETTPHNSLLRPAK